MNSAEEAEIHVKVLGKESPNYPNLLHTVARVHAALGEHEEASSFLTEAVGLLEKRAPPRPLAYPRVLNTLAWEQWVSGKDDEARKSLWEAQKERAKALGESRREYLDGQSHLATLLYLLGDRGAPGHSPRRFSRHAARPSPGSRPP
jgi:hypothetical protein